MATYKYKCLTCNDIFNINATIQEKEEGKKDKFSCPKCQSKNIKEQFSASNFMKNIFTDDKGCCCSGGNTCKPTKNKDNDCGCKNNKGGCC